jgi:hypothetical protein
MWTNELYARNLTFRYCLHAGTSPSALANWIQIILAHQDVNCQSRLKVMELGLLTVKTLSLLIELAVYPPLGDSFFAANACQWTRLILVSWFEQDAMPKMISFLCRKRLQRDLVRSGVGAVQVTLSGQFRQLCKAPLSINTFDIK